MVLCGVVSNTLDLVVMKGHAYLLGSHTCLRTILSAVLLAGTAAGAAVREGMVA